MATVRLRIPLAPAEEQAARVATAGAPAEVVLAATAEESPSQRRLHRLVVLAALALVVACAAALTAVTHDPTFGRPPTQPKDGLTILAVFFVAAQALERLLEPLSGLLLPKSRLEDDYQTALGEAERLAGAEPGLGLAAVPTEIEAALHRAAAAKARLEGREQDRAIGYWALATVLAMLGSATLRLYILHELGIANASRGLEILATGLIIGAGTKPLHDLVTNLADRHAQGAAAPGP
ncbi:MAG TPA: hypothetical protein VFD04_09885 [Actinomycetes bacterium]|jgi:hypothetical protein|nr:hypothetical protein [Actinomycetes bacterium]